MNRDLNKLNEFRGYPWKAHLGRGTLGQMQPYEEFPRGLAVKDLVLSLL